MTNAKQFNLKPSYEEILKYYDVNQKGQVFKIKTGKRIKSHLKKGYERVAFTIEGKRFMYTVHRMVAVKYLPNPYKLAQVNHLDANKTNNNIENLEWCTPLENSRHAKTMGRSGVNKRKANLLCESDVRYILNLRANGQKVKEIANKMALKESLVWSIVVRKRWKHVTL